MTAFVPAEEASRSPDPREPPGLRAWAEISAAAVAHNIAYLKRRFEGGGRTRVMAVLKADAYGHGMELVVPLCARHGLTDFGVATAVEGAALRAVLPPDSAIYLLSPPWSAEAETIVACDLIPLVSDLSLGHALSDVARARGTRVRVHLDVDTGMGRSGVPATEAPALLNTLHALPSLRVTGLATHFARADEDLDDAQAQYRQFSTLLTGLGEDRARGLIVHAANSPAALALPSAVYHQLVRPGLLLYGIEPSPGAFVQSEADLRPVLSLRARVLLCRPLPGGATISYGKTYTVPTGGGVYATLGIGYGDGYPRALSNRGHVLIRGQRAPICGRVCMDQMVVDVSRIPGVRAGDLATLIGTDGTETITAGDLAELAGTTPHEITTSLLPRVRRVLA